MMNSPYKGKFKISQIFKGKTHKGKDFVGITSKDIFSTVNGVVESARRDTDPNDANNKNYGMGNYIRIKDEKTGLLWYFAHLSKILVRKGDKVSKGQQIGVEGSTGHSTGSHLHMEVRESTDNTTFVDSSELTGIPNVQGTYIQNDEIDPDIVEAMKVVQEKAGLSSGTISMMYAAFDDFKFEESLWVKLADAMR